MILIESARRAPKRDFRAGAQLLEQAFPHSYAGTGIKEMKLLREKERVLLFAYEKGELIGMVGAIPQYGATGWELHPLVVREDRRGAGVGTLLVRALERELMQRGGVMIYLGSDDDQYKTSLSQGDLFDHPLEKIAAIQNHKRHPYEFYQKLGYQIVGVLPDANGQNKPDIWLARRIVPYAPDQADSN